MLASSTIGKQIGYELMRRGDMVAEMVGTQGIASLNEDLTFLVGQLVASPNLDSCRHRVTRLVTHMCKLASG